MHHFFTFIILSLFIGVAPAISQEATPTEPVFAFNNASTESSSHAGETRKVLSYRTHGTGPAIYLLADGPGMSSGYLDEVGETLSRQGFTAIVPESRHAYYSTDINKQPVSLADYVEDIERLRQSRGDEEIILFGHKFGGILAMAYLTRYGSHVKKVVLSGPAGAHMGYFQDYGRRLVQRVSPYEQNLVADLKDSLAKGGDKLALGLEILRITSMSLIHNKEKHGKDLEDRFIGKTTFNEEVYCAMIKHMRESRYDLREEITRYYRPVLVVQGEFDITGHRHAVSLSDSFPDGSLHMISESASYPWIENPDEYYGAITGFIK